MEVSLLMKNCSPSRSKLLGCIQLFYKRSNDMLHCTYCRLLLCTCFNPGQFSYLQVNLDLFSPTGSIYSGTLSALFLHLVFFMPFSCIWLLENYFICLKTFRNLYFSFRKINKEIRINRVIGLNFVLLFAILFLGILVKATNAGLNGFFSALNTAHSFSTT